MAETNQKDTYFAPAGRVPVEVLREQVNAVMDSPILDVVLEAVSGYVLVLNEQRQMLAANQELIDALDRNSAEDDFSGLRPGEFFQCVHVPEGPDGCGTAPHCAGCGAVIAILACQQNRTVTDGECRMNIEKGEQLIAADFKVRATPVKINEHELTVIVLQDISHDKRREVLERVFLHDFLNLVGGIKGWSEQLQGATLKQAAQQIMLLSSLLKEEVQFQTLLAMAEKNELKTVFKFIQVREVLAYLKDIFQLQVDEEKKELDISATGVEQWIETDRGLLLRVLTNMIKNALEATPPGGKVSVGYERQDGRPRFWVHNDGAIPLKIFSHIFERSFSTKGSGRGIGTYSIRLFGEQYLKGKVSFTSSVENGTTFKIELPAQDRLSKRKSGAGTPQAPELKKVLLVDDDENQLLLGKLLLERLGYLVQVCCSGIEAVEQLAAASGEVAFVLTDYSMAPIDGLETARRILAIDPALTVVLCSGYEDLELIRLAHQTGIRSIGLKPTTRKEMAGLLENAGLRKSDFH